jgi:hypothetical protein
MLADLRDVSRLVRENPEWSAIEALDRVTLGDEARYIAVFIFVGGESIAQYRQHPDLLARLDDLIAKLEREQ